MAKHYDKEFKESCLQYRRDHPELNGRILNLESDNCKYYMISILYYIVLTGVKVQGFKPRSC